jgi:hypothetical protein
MRLRSRLSTTTAGLVTAWALTATLSGCMTVHGEEAIVPATTEEDAARALERFTEVYNEARATNDGELISTVETGGLAAIDSAGLRARANVAQEEQAGQEEVEPLELSDTRFLIPEQAGWPKFFVVETASSLTESRWLMVFTRDAVDAEWSASYLSLLDPARMPELAVEDGHLVDIPLAGPEADRETGLAVEPAELSAAYAEYLDDGQGPFTEGPYTTETLARRDEANDSAAYLIRYLDEEAPAEAFPTVALRTADGGALVLFTTVHHEEITMAEGETPVLDPLTRALLEGEEDTPRKVTLDRVAIQAALVPDGEGDVTLLTQMGGLTAAVGE